MFELIGKLAEKIEEEMGIELRYCGEFHFRKESGHAMTNDHTIMAKIEMDDQRRAEAIEKVNLVFAWFTEWTEELLAYTKENLNHSLEPVAQKISMSSVYSF
ncbi:MAG: hypothetical protein V7K97_22855 [Nostoc sp.]|uniref:hypothetical protein n=1 Tax=Nostoc sp. TaxID=1180 RepID=UPI002FF9541D